MQSSMKALGAGSPCGKDRSLWNTEILSGYTIGCACGTKGQLRLRRRRSDGNTTGTYKLEIGLETPHDQPRRLGRHQVAPLLAVHRVDVHSEVGHPVHPRRLSVPVVIHIIDMLLSPLAPSP